jgi:hypothetical protein
MARRENGGFILVVGSSRSLIEALQQADTEMERWLMANYGFDARGSSLLLGQTMESNRQCRGS